MRQLEDKRIVVTLRNCNNIDRAEIAITRGKLNIKFAPNGTGKSTIAQALLLRVSGDEAPYKELVPFKFRNSNPQKIEPEILGAESFMNVMCFNEKYVDQFVFRPDELISNSFDVFIRTNDYQTREQEIEELVRQVKGHFVENQELEELIDQLRKMAEAFKLSSQGIDRRSTGMKGLSGGNKMKHVPDGLESYAPFIQSEMSVRWIDWQTQGYSFLDLSASCPFCTANKVEKEAQIRKLGQEYDKNVIKNLIALISIIDKLGDYFSPSAKSTLDKIADSGNTIDSDDEKFLVNVATQIDALRKTLEKLRTLSAFQFNNGERVNEVLAAWMIDLQEYDLLDSMKMRNAIEPINNSINELISQAGVLQGKINQQHSRMKKTIENHQTDINDFLNYAGYRYSVEIVGEGESAQLKLRHIDHKEYLSGGIQHLSFGEKNAFAIVLFMYDCISKDPDLIILDDPISSFDKNKKYAILEMLFRRSPDKCLKDKTVLMLTHDVEPIIDTIKSLADRFRNRTSATFLKLSAGFVSEVDVTRDDVKTFAQICKAVIASEKDEIVKLVYLRRSLEIEDNMTDAYQVLSNLLHRGNNKARGIDKRKKDAEGNYLEMGQDDFDRGCKEIERRLPGFSYQKLLDRIIDVEAMKKLYRGLQNGYDKLQVFRLIPSEVESAVLKKFIDQTYHIENEFISQLDPAKYDYIPEYVVAECDKLLESLPNKRDCGTTEK